LILPFLKPDPDAPLVAAARAGDVRAFDALVYRYQGRILQFVQARLDASIDTDDVAQDIFVTAWRELPKFQGRSRFKTWLFGIALNRCAEAARKHHRLKLVLGERRDRKTRSTGPWRLPSERPSERAWPPSRTRSAGCWSFTTTPN
jgi:RNA polymerase sigma factor (sigma-70 family)